MNSTWVVERVAGRQSWRQGGRLVMRLIDYVVMAQGKAQSTGQRVMVLEPSLLTSRTAEVILPPPPPSLLPYISVKWSCEVHHEIHQVQRMLLRMQMRWRPSGALEVVAEIAIETCWVRIDLLSWREHVVQLDPKQPVQLVDSARGVQYWGWQPCTVRPYRY